MADTDTIRLNWRKSETHGLLARSRAAPDPLHALLDRRPPRRAAAACSTAGCPRGSQDRAPKVVETEEGHEVWQFDGKIFFQVGLNAVVGRKTRRLEGRADPLRRDAPRLLRRRRPRPRHGHQRRVGVGQLPVADHRLLRLGVLALQRSRARPRGDAGVERLVLRRVVLAASRPHRADGHHLPRRSPRRAREEIRRNAARGFTAVTLPEMPHRIGMEPIFSAWWDPIIAACAETGHRRSACTSARPASPTCRPGAPMVPLGATLFGQLSLSACAEWLWSGYPVKYPDLKIIMSEGGIGWVAMLHDRLENIVDRSGYGSYFPGDLRPAEVLHRNFWFSHDRRPVDALHARHGRRRPHHVRVRLPARRRHLARHARRCSPTCSAASPPTRSRRSATRTRPRLFRHPLPAARQPPRRRSPDLTKGTSAAKPVHKLAPR